MTHAQARKRFGQHFLVDEAVIDQIIRAIAPRPEQMVVEIGPGLSALTGPLMSMLGHLTVIEIDRDLIAGLRRRFPADRLTVVQGDVLGVDFSALGDRLRVVGNLPYNISSPLLFHLRAYAGKVVDQHFMLQREVVDRLVAQPATHDYGRLSVMLQSRYRIRKLFDVSPDAFDPPPRVVSSVVRMVPLSGAYPRPKSEAAFEQVVARAFGQRRKMLRRALGDWTSLIDWNALGAPATSRAEELTAPQFIALSDQLLEAGALQA